MKKRWSKSCFGCYNGIVRNRNQVFCKSDIVALGVGIIVCAIIYVWLAFLLNLVGKDDIPHLPLKRLLWALHRTIRFWEYNNETR